MAILFGAMLFAHLIITSSWVVRLNHQWLSSDPEKVKKIVFGLQGNRVGLLECFVTFVAALILILPSAGSLQFLLDRGITGAGVLFLITYLLMYEVLTWSFVTTVKIAEAFRLNDRLNSEIAEES